MKSWIWTGQSIEALVPGMDDSEELIVHLCTHAGMIMEDASVVALTIGAIPAPQRAAALEELLKSAAAINSLVEAALVVSH